MAGALAAMLDPDYALLPECTSQHVAWMGYMPKGTQHSYNYMYNMIYITVKTYVANLPFSIQPQIPQYH
jgi:hypothetical protein